MPATGERQFTLSTTEERQFTLPITGEKQFTLPTTGDSLHCLLLEEDRKGGVHETSKDTTKCTQLSCDSPLPVKLGYKENIQN